MTFFWIFFIVSLIVIALISAVLAYFHTIKKPKLTERTTVTTEIDSNSLNNNISNDLSSNTSDVKGISNLNSNSNNSELINSTKTSNNEINSDKNSSISKTADPLSKYSSTQDALVSKSALNPISNSDIKTLISNIKKDSNLITLQIKVPKDINDDAKTAANSMEQLLSALHGIMDVSPDALVSFEIANEGGEGISFFVTLPTNIKSFVQNQIYAQFKGAQIIEIKDPLLKEKNIKKYCKVINLNLSKNTVLPINSYTNFELDSLGAVSASLSEIKKGDFAYIQCISKPIDSSWQKSGRQYIERLRKGESASLENKSFLSKVLSSIKGVFSGAFDRILYGNSSDIDSSDKKDQLTTIQQDEIKGIEEKITKVGYKTQIKVFVCSDNELNLHSYLNSLSTSFAQYKKISNNSFNRVDIKLKNPLQDIVSREFNKNSFVLNINELATVYHFPSSRLETANIRYTKSTKGEPPENLPVYKESTKDDMILIGETNFRDKTTKFGILNGEDRLRHFYVVGKTGSGKSQLFENMVVQDIAQGHGVCFIDPHGSAIEKILKRIPKERINDVCLIDPSDEEYPIGLNIIESDPKGKKNNLKASGILSAFKRQFGDSWGPRLEYLLNYSLLTLANAPGTTMLSVVRLLTDKNYRKFLVHSATDPVVRQFWDKEYPELEKSGIGPEAVSPIQNKVGRFLSNPLIRNILGQKNSTVNIEEMMNNEKILLINLSKGKIGEDNSNLLGSLIIDTIQFYALKREEIKEEDRKPFYLYVDEFQNFATDSFASILSESRKYGLSLHLTHQYTKQLPETIKDAILGNVGTIMALTLGAQDASDLAPEFAPTFTDKDLVNQERYSFYIKQQIEGFQSSPYSGKTLAPEKPPIDYSKEIKEASRKRYGVPKWYVEEKINRWVKRPFDLGMAIAKEMKDKNKEV